VTVPVKARLPDFFECAHKKLKVGGGVLDYPQVGQDGPLSEGPANNLRACPHFDGVALRCPNSQSALRELRCLESHYGPVKSRFSVTPQAAR